MVSELLSDLSPNCTARIEISAAVGIRHQPESLLRLMRSVARNVATEAKVARLAADAGSDGPLSRGIATAYFWAYLD